MTHFDCDICVIGAGAGGLTVAGGAAMFGLKTILVEAAEMGGDCLNTGCVPSKTLLANARKAQQQSLFRKLIADLNPGINWQKPNHRPNSLRNNMADVSRAIAEIAPHDSVERFEELGVEVIKGRAVFTGPRQIDVAGRLITARKFVIATGSQPRVPSAIGLDNITYFTTESIWALRDRPDSLMIIGAGATGLELGQAFAHMGTAVTLVERGTILPSLDDDVRDVLRRKLEADHMCLYEQSEITTVSNSGGKIKAHVRLEGGSLQLITDAVLIAAGRTANIEGLGLEAAGVAYSAQNGIETYKGLQTSNRHIYAVGDVRGAPFYTHAAGHDAIVALKQIVFKLPVKPDYAHMPSVIFTTPEVAHIGCSADLARQQWGAQIKVITHRFSDVDRYICEGEQQGFAQLVLGKHDKLLGCTIVGASAGELILPWQLVFEGKITIKDLSDMTYAYPVRSEITKHLADKVTRPKFFTKSMKFLAHVLKHI